jgi:hypothetical protein
MPRLLWELATTGQTTLPDGRLLAVDSASEMMAIWKFLYNHIDGPPKTELDVEHSGDLEVFLSWGDPVEPDGDDA